MSHNSGSKFKLITFNNEENAYKKIGEVKMNKFDLEMMEDELRTIQKRARVRLVNLQDIEEAIFEIQSLIEGFSDPREILSRDTAIKFITDFNNGFIGMTFKVNPNAQSFYSSYNGKPESTNFYLKVEKDGSIGVINICRESCNSTAYRYLGRKEVNV